MDKNFYCVIMAGGIGSRFWPVSRNSMPKQFLDILGTGRSFLQETFDRFAKIVPTENILCVTSTKYGAKVKEQLPDMLEENILMEPLRRNTAPCIAYATYKIAKRNPDAVVVVTPSDHAILNEVEFLNTISGAMEYSKDHNYLFTLGITPTRPETGYGYIQKNTSEICRINGRTAYNVKTFTEKPDAELAKVFLSSGEFLWNSGIFVWNLQAIMKEMELHLPEIANFFKDGMSCYYTPEEKKFIAGVYDAITGISIDYGVMEKTENSWVFESSFGWSDLGTWHSLYAYVNKDHSNNVVCGAHLMNEESKGNLVFTSKKGKLVVLSGISNYMVVDTEDAIMICPRDEKKFKNIITDLTVNELTDFQ